MADPLWAVPAAGGLDTGGLDRLGGPVVLARLPDDRVAIVLAAVVDGHPDPEREGGLPVPDRLAPVAAALVGRHSVVGIQPVEGAFGVADWGGVDRTCHGGRVRLTSPRQGDARCPPSTQNRAEGTLRYVAQVLWGDGA